MSVPGSGLVAVARATTSVLSSHLVYCAVLCCTVPCTVLYCAVLHTTTGARLTTCSRGRELSRCCMLQLHQG